MTGRDRQPTKPSAKCCARGIAWHTRRVNGSVPGSAYLPAQTVLFCSVLFCSVDTVTVQRVPDVRSERLTDWAWPTVNRGAFAAWPKKQQGGDECRSNAPEIDEVPVEKNQQD